MKSDSLEILIQKVLEADQAYYSGDKPIMSDQEYDGLKKAIEAIDPKHPILAKVGHDPSPAWKKRAHSIAMGSLNNVFTEEDFRKWAGHFPLDTVFTAQPKLDGLSVSLDYSDGEFQHGTTRGNKTEGEEITDNAALMQNCLFATQNPFDGSIRGEIVLSKADFININSTLPEDDQYSNARNAAAGISRRLDGKYCQYLMILPYDIIETDAVYDENKKLDVLKSLGFRVPTQVVGDVDKMVWAFSEMKKKREGYPIGLDGMVVKACSSEIQKSAGVVNNRPKAMIAWKFDPPGAVTKLEKVTFDVGRTGVVTPLGWVEPAKIDGSVIRKVTLHNIAEIQRLGIGIGDLVTLTKRGDVIPKVETVLESKGMPIEIPTRCPSCDSVLDNDGIRLMCRNSHCPKKNFNRIMNWIKVTEIDGFGEALAEALQGAGKLNHIRDIYDLKVEDIASLEGWGHKSAKTILESIGKTRSLSAIKFLAGIGIPGISFRTSEELMRHFRSVPKLRVVTAEEIKELRGFSDISASAIVKGLDEYWSDIESLMGYISIPSIGDEASRLSEKTGPLSGMSFCFTGAMSKPRPVFQKMVEDLGGVSSSAVVKNLTYLVCNEDKGSSKSQKAKQYGVKIISEQGFLAMAGIMIDPPATPTKPTYEVESLFEEE